MNSAIVKKVMREMGRKGGMVGGRSRLPAKVSAARENGKMGGRPKKSPGKDVRHRRDPAMAHVDK